MCNCLCSGPAWTASFIRRIAPSSTKIVGERGGREKGQELRAIQVSQTCFRHVAKLGRASQGFSTCHNINCRVLHCTVPCQRMFDDLACPLDPVVQSVHAQEDNVLFRRKMVEITSVFRHLYCITDDQGSRVVPTTLLLQCLLLLAYASYVLI